MSEKPLEKKHIITIAGKPGSGKSTSSKSLATELGYQHFSSGDLFRTITSEMGMQLAEASSHAEKDTSIDHQVDQRLRDIGESEDNMVIDSRMAWHWMPQSFKVYLNLDMRLAAERIIAGTDPARLESEHIPSDPAEYAAILESRFASEARRYESLYGVNPYNFDNYDLVVDTSLSDPQQVVRSIVSGFRHWSSTH